MNTTNEQKSDQQVPVIHLISNAHLDPVWLWEWEEGVAAALSTFRTAADLCEEFGSFVFNHNEAILYRWVEEYEPILFERIQRLVKAGKWHIMGGWYLQPDCNMPSGESFVRQLLLGRRYFAEKFGARPTTAINFDPFGHTRGLVQIMARCGFDSYLICRPDQNNCQLPEGPFWWEGYDGSRVKVLRPRQWYNSPLGHAREKVEEFITKYKDDNPGLILWGVGDHGGGPSHQDLQALEALIEETNHVEIRHSVPEAYFQSVQGDELAIHIRDINPWGVGCYTSMAQVKQHHRMLENKYFMTEKMAAAAWCLKGFNYPVNLLKEALLDLATSEFHDILPGSSIQPVEEMALRLMNHGLELCSRIMAGSFFSLAEGQAPARTGEIPILVYNPHPYPIQTTVECEFQLADQNWDDQVTQITVHQGEESLPTQVEQEKSSLALDWRKRVVFQTLLQPAQMNRFDCRLYRTDKPAAAMNAAQPDQLHFHNPDLDVVINFHTGFIDSYRVGGVEFLRPGACRPRVMIDDPDPWGMRVRSYRQSAGSFRLLSPKKAAVFAGLDIPALPPVRVIEDGEVRTVIEALFGYHDSKLCMHYKLPKQGTEVEIEIIVQWNEKNRMLKLALPVHDRGQHFLGQVAFGTGELPENGEEAVFQKWLALAGSTSAFTMVNDRIYSADYDHSELRLSLLRSPGYAVHPIMDRPLVPQDRYTARQDQGERTFHFWMNGGERTARMQNIDREAMGHNEVPFALSFFPPGDAEKTNSFLSLDDPAVQVTAVKRAEDSDDLVIRLFEPTGKARSTRLHLPWVGMVIPVELGKFEIRTITVNWKEKTWRNVNLIEE